MRDALSIPVSQWTAETLLSVLGHREGQRLEFKSNSFDPDKSSDRDKLAQEIAAFSTSEGGYIVIGTDDGETPTALPGYPDLKPAQIDSLRKAIWDRVRPAPFVDGPIRLPGDSGDVIAIEVRRHPARLPVGTSSKRFFMRVDDESRPMTVDEVIRRIESVATAGQSASGRAGELLAKLRRELEGANRRPAAIALVSMYSDIDLGFSGTTATRRRT